MQSKRVDIVYRNISLRADLLSAAVPQALVLFAHGSGSGRHSPRNRFVARALLDYGMSSLLVDLMTEEEETFDSLTRELRFDIDLLTRRLIATIDTVKEHPELAMLPIGLFGASTGAAAAFGASAERASDVRALVSRGGRPDLADRTIDRVYAPTLFLVGGHDGGILELNQMAFDRIPARDKKLELIPRATHLFEEPGALEQVMEKTVRWFESFLLEQPSARQAG